MTYLWYVPPAGTEDSRYAHKHCIPVCSYELPDELHFAMLRLLDPHTLDLDVEIDDRTGEVLSITETPLDPKIVEFLPNCASPAFILEQWAADPGELQIIAPDWFIREALPALAAAARQEEPEAGEDAMIFYRWIPA